MKKKLYQTPATIAVEIAPASILCTSTEGIFIDPNAGEGLIGG